MARWELWCWLYWERQRAGIEAAKAKGVYKGWPSSLDHDKIKELNAQGMGATAIARELGCSRGAVYKSVAWGRENVFTVLVR